MEALFLVGPYDMSNK